MPVPLGPEADAHLPQITRKLGPDTLIPEGAAPESKIHVFSLPLAELDDWKAGQFRKVNWRIKRRENEASREAKRTAYREARKTAGAKCSTTLVSEPFSFNFN
jgi:hypothetical protein